MSKRVAVGAGVILIVFGLAGAAMYVGTPWSYLGILAAASGGAIIGSWLTNRKTDQVSPSDLRPKAAIKLASGLATANDSKRTPGPRSILNYQSTQ